MVAHVEALQHDNAKIVEAMAEHRQASQFNLTVLVERVKVQGAKLVSWVRHRTVPATRAFLADAAAFVKTAARKVTTESGTLWRDAQPKLRQLAVQADEFINQSKATLSIELLHNGVPRQHVETVALTIMVIAALLVLLIVVVLFKALCGCGGSSKRKNLQTSQTTNVM
eukprot:TRINITY_DN65928_c6_g2_i2.p1 TRINITY_DN65928_c6_g2~~TRINITY_DN65928_c6_g2_i2.p1  ORF type:complete len:169 (+),score=86.27 TRINITY_DN65928_c6_g2_i2:81-587(+)